MPARGMGLSREIRALLAMLLVVAGVTVAGADDFSDRDQFFARLSAPMNSIVDGKSFRDGLADIAEQASLNLWLDRMVDPTAPISAGPVGPTVFAAIEKIAAQRDCVVMPVAGVTLVGRASWVDQTVASVLSLGPQGDRASPEVAWDDLTTPNEALARCLASDGQAATVDASLPHDLWPATKWKQINRRIAIALVVAQFDLRPEFASGSVTSFVPAKDSGSFTRRYGQNDAEDAIRRVISEADPKSRVRVSRGWLVVSGSASAHRAAAIAMLGAKANQVGPDPDNDTFTLKKMNTTAENAFRQLAAVARRTCVIDAAARQACSKMVSIEGEDTTLRKLIDMIADQAGVTAVWTGDTITISPLL